LGLAEIEKIVELMFAELRARLAERGISLELTPEGRHLIATRGYDPVYGARPLRRFVSHEVETRVGRALLSGDVGDGGRIVVDARNEELSIRWQHEDQYSPV
jgi:ATP-dependent Clp protease ATP-binding subunit ClpB